ncbi:MAG: putative toxin-antitoxin system toxin component, PIN family [Planctomycetes bacterium]|nr:putative toxin-antitoxin system toxin component, PIN family [Planctomycetota bacterium]
MKRHSAVIDTNVLYAGLYSALGASFQVLRLIENGDLTPLLSTTLLFEYEEVLRRHQELLKLSDRAVNSVLDGICRHGECRRIHFLWRPQLSDPKDDHILELAVAAESADIVTHNVKDFALADAFGVRIIRPGKLLGELK